MKTIIINGSPKGKNGNTEISINNFIRGISKDIEIKRIVEEDYQEFANLINGFDHIILAFHYISIASPVL